MQTYENESIARSFRTAEKEELAEDVSNCCSAPVDDFERCMHCQEPCDIVTTE